MASKSYAKRKLIDNSHRYQEESSENVEVRGKDFALAVAAASGGSSHFRLRDEKAWCADLTDPEEISIDLVKLKMCLECIPFNALLQCPDDVITAEELKLFHDQADSAKQAYNLHKELNTPKVEHNSGKILSSIRTEKWCDLVENIDDDVEDELELLLNNKFTGACSIPSENQTTSKQSMEVTNCTTARKSTRKASNDQFEDWLDNMLTD